MKFETRLGRRYAPAAIRSKLAAPPARLRAGRKTFGEIADALIEAKVAEWRNAKHREQWRRSLLNDAAPLRSKPVDEIDTAAILEVLKPLWTKKPESASRLRQRIEAVLDAAKAQGLRSGENPARWKGHLSHLLPKRQKLARGHFAALPYAALPDFMEKLRELDTVAARALEFAILTAARSGEVYGASWSEIDFDAKVWTIPAERMKSGRQHRIPVCDRALDILRAVRAIAVSEFVFPGRKRGKPLSHVAMAKVIERMGSDVTVHGFRSAFRDWCGNETHFAREVAEAALAHVVGDKAEQAYGIYRHLRHSSVSKGQKASAFHPLMRRNFSRRLGNMRPAGIRVARLILSRFALRRRAQRARTSRRAPISRSTRSYEAKRALRAAGCRFLHPRICAAKLLQSFKLHCRHDL